MEERVAHAGDGNGDPPLKPTSLPAAAKPTETYVVQIPRDQVYRIPPPENANIVESHRKPSNDRRHACGGRCIFTILAVVLLGLGVFLAINSFNYVPKSPEVAITRFQKRILNSPMHRTIVSQYEVSLHVRNPNPKLDVHYGVGNVTLNFKGHEIAYGGSQLVQEQGRGTSINVQQSLNEAKGVLPESVEKSMNDKLPKALALKIDVPIEVQTRLKTIEKEMIVGCDLEVDSFSEGAKILSQKCGAGF